MSRGRLLIIEPQPLLRWSLATYLGRWFDVFPTDTVDAATAVLHSELIGALVFSDDLPDAEKQALRALLAQVEEGPSVICTTTEPGVLQGCVQEGIVQIEKPFELRRLAILLGVDEKCLSKPT